MDRKHDRYRELRDKRKRSKKEIEEFQNVILEYERLERAWKRSGDAKDIKRVSRWMLCDHPSKEQFTALKDVLKRLIPGLAS